MYRILIAEDDILNRESLYNLLKNKGYEVITAKSGKEAIHQLSIQTPDLVITDILMPEVDGIELIMEVKREYPLLKIIAMSAGGHIGANEHLLTARRLGVVIEKPINQIQLFNLISKLGLDNNKERA